MVVVRVRDDGSGTVTVHVVADPAAVSAAGGGGSLDDRVRLGDLETGGWTVRPWVARPDGSATLVLSKPFTRVAEVSRIVREISGPSGPFRSFHVTRERAFFTTRFGASGVIDLGQVATGVTTDQLLADRLAAQGVDVHAIDQQLLSELHEALRVGVRVRLPGGADRTARADPGKTASIDARTTVLDTTRVALVAGAAGFGLLAIVAVLWPGRPRPRGRRTLS
jgi:hypothetical protein